MKKLLIFIVCLSLVFTSLNIFISFHVQSAAPTCEIGSLNCIVGEDGGGGGLVSIAPRPDSYVPNSIYDLNISPNMDFLYGFDLLSPYLNYSERVSVNGLYYAPFIGTSSYQETDSCAILGPDWMRTGYKYVSYFPNNYIGLSNQLTSSSNTFIDYVNDLYYVRYDQEFWKVYEILDKCKRYGAVREEWEITGNDIIIKYAQYSNMQHEFYYIPIKVLAENLQDILNDLDASQVTALDMIVQSAYFGGTITVDALLAAGLSVPSISLFGALFIQDLVQLKINDYELSSIDFLITHALDYDEILYIHKHRDTTVIVLPWFSDYYISDIGSVKLDVYDEYGNVIDYAYSIELLESNYQNTYDTLLESMSESYFDTIVDWFQNPS